MCQGEFEECNGRPSADLHSCPFKEEINDDYETMCNCCTECTNQCAMEV